MAGEGYRALAAAKQKQKKIAWERDIGMEAISSVGAVAAFAGGQAKKAETAWGEYEAGYEEIGKGIEGFEGIDKRPEWGDKGYFKSRFKGPEGEVTIGEGKERRTYDREKIQKAGSFLSSDAASVLSDKQRSKYLGRTAPGRADPLTGKLKSPLTQITGDTGYSESATSFGTGNVREFKMGGGGSMFADPLTFGQDTGGIGVQHELTGGDFQPFVGGERGRDATGTAQLQLEQRQNVSGVDPKSLDISGAAYDKLVRQRHFQYAEDMYQPATSMARIQGREDVDFSQYTSTKVAPGPQIPESQLSENLETYAMSAEERAGRKTQESAWDVQRSNVNKFKSQSLEGYDAMSQYRMNSYAHGGDFITNGPQEILVGDNASGRERVTITPLDSEDYKPKGYYGKKRNWLEALYENNRRRKKY